MKPRSVKYSITEVDDTVLNVTVC